MAMQTFSVKTHRRTELVLLTPQVTAAIKALGVGEGMVTVFIPHTTAGVTINENADPDVAADLERIFDHLVPWAGGYAHAEGKSAAHARASLVGASVTVPVSKGHPRMGTWQGIYLCEFDGPRTRTIWVIG